MTSALDPVIRALAAFLAGGAHAPLWEAVQDAADAVDADVRVSERARDWFDELYDAVSMGTDGPVSGARAQAGVVDAEALRAQLREAGLDRVPGR